MYAVEQQFINQNTKRYLAPPLDMRSSQFPQCANAETAVSHGEREHKWVIVCLWGRSMPAVTPSLHRRTNVPALAAAALNPTHNRRQALPASTRKKLSFFRVATVPNSTGSHSSLSMTRFVSEISREDCSATRRHELHGDRRSEQEASSGLVDVLYRKTDGLRS
jgi:hypothetical protein